MPVLTNLRSFELRNQYRNGDNFASRPAEFSTNFVGAVGEVVQATYEIDLSWFASASSLSAWQINSGVIERTSGSFLDDGFAVGQSFEFFPDWAQFNNASSEFTASVDAIISNGARLEFTVTTGTQTTTGTNSIAGISAEANTVAVAPDAAILRFNILPNNAAFSNVSQLTGTAQSWYAGGIDLAGGTTSSMQVVGSDQGWKSGSAMIRRSAFSQVKNGVSFEIVHTFRILPFYTVNYLSNLQAGTVPAFWQSELNYFFEIEFRDGLTNTGSAKVAAPALPSGASAWFGESVGGFFARYFASNQAFVDTTTAAPVAAVQLDKRTTVTFDLDRVGVPGSSAGFVSGEKVTLFIAYLPDTESEYQQTVTDADSNFLIDTISASATLGPTVGSGIFKTCEATLSGGTMQVSAELEYNSAQQIQASGGNYLLWAQVGDLNFAVNSSDRSCVIISLDQFVQVEFISGLSSLTKFNILAHNQDLGSVTGTEPGAVLNQWPEDGVLADFTLQLNAAQSAVLTGLTFALVAYKNDDTFFFLDSYPIDLSSGVVSSGTQQFAIDTTRGYLLRAGDQFNFVQLATGATGVGTQDYDGSFAQKIKWQDWLFNPDADTIFYDANEPNNNLNFYSENYSGINDYSIRLIAIIETQGQDANGVLGVGRDVAVSCEIDVFDYGEPDGGWVGTITTHDPDTGANLGGAILGNKNTLFRTTWSDGNPSLNSIFAIHRIQNTGSLGDDIEEISSLYLPPNQRLIPKPGQTQLEVYLSGSDIISECLIDYTRLSGDALNLSARIGRPPLPPQFTVSYAVCSMILTEIYGGPITSINYTFQESATIRDTVTGAGSPFNWQPAAFFSGQIVEVFQEIITPTGSVNTSLETTVPGSLSNCIWLELETNKATPFVIDVGYATGNTFFTYYGNDVETFTGTSSINLPGFASNTRVFFTGNSGNGGLFESLNIENSGILGTLDLSGLSGLGVEFRANNNPDLSQIVNPSSSQNFSIYFVQECNLTGTLDLSGLSGFGGQFIARINPNLLQIVNPSNSNVFTRYDVKQCNLTGTLDISSLSGLGGEFQANNNPNLSQVVNPSSSQNFSIYAVQECNLTGTLDLTTLPGLGGQFRANNNTNLTQVVNPSSSQNFSVYWVQECGLTGTLDLTTLPGLGGQFIARSNPNLSQIINPSSSRNFSLYWADNCNLTGTLDVSGLSGLGGEFRANNNTNLLQIINPSSSRNFSLYWAQACNLAGTLDLSGLSGLGGQFRANNNPNLSQIINPSSSQNFSIYFVQECDLTGTLDLSGLSGLGGQFIARINPNLTGINFPIASNAFSVFDISQTGLDYISLSSLSFSNSGLSFKANSTPLSATSVNNYLIDLDSLLPAGTGSIEIIGTSPAPTGAGITAKNNLIAKGYTLTTN